MRVAVVGAGPAGSIVALLLARAGIAVTLLERADSPRAKPCGDCMSAEATRVLDRLGILAAVQRAGPARLAGWRIVAPRGGSFSARFEDLDTGDPRLRCALALGRDRLDAILLDAARAAGADVRTRTVVTDVVTERALRLLVRGPCATESVHADLVVGADGLRSTIARRVGAVRRRPRVRKVSLTAHIEGAALPAAFGEMHLAPDLCAGLAPVGAGRFNLTLVADTQRYGRAVAAGPLDFFRTALRHFPGLPERLTDARLDGDPLLGGPTRPAHPSTLLASGPFDVPVRPIVGPGWALVGDAAGYFDPFTGQGIVQAMRGAELLADAILEAVAEPADGARALARYARTYRRMRAHAHALQRLIDSVLRRPDLADRAIARLAAAPAAARALLAVTGDVRAPSSLLSPAALLSFALPRLRRATG